MKRKRLIYITSLTFAATFFNDYFRFAHSSVRTSMAVGVVWTQTIEKSLLAIYFFLVFFPFFIGLNQFSGDSLQTKFYLFSRLLCFFLFIKFFIVFYSNVLIKVF